MGFSFKKFIAGLNIVPKTTSSSSEMGDLEVLSGTTKLSYHNGTTVSPVVTESQAATLTNKVIDADLNTISNIENADIKPGANIARNKLAPGSVNQVVINDGSGVLSSEAALNPSRGGTGVSNNSAATLTRTGNFDLNLTLTGASNITAPLSGTLATLAGVEQLTNKDIDGGTASNTSRITLPKNTTGNLNGLTRKQGTVVYDTSTNQVKYDDGATLNALGAATVSDSSIDIQNLQLNCSVAGNALTIAVKTKAGTDPTVSDPVRIGFRSSTASSGAYNVRNITGALSFTVSSGSTLGTASGNTYYVYPYFLDNAGTVELAVSLVVFDDHSIQSSTAEGGAGAADLNSVLYSSTARANVPIRLIGRLTTNQVTAGLWALAPTEVSLNTLQSLSPELIAMRVFRSTNQGINNSSNDKVQFSDKSFDTHNAFDIAGSTFRFTAPVAGIYDVEACIGFDPSANGQRLVYIFKNGSIYAQGSEGSLITAIINPQAGSLVSLVVGDYIEVFAFQDSGGTQNLRGDASGTISYLNIKKVR